VEEKKRTYIDFVTLVDTDERARELAINNDGRTIETIGSQICVYNFPVIVNRLGTTESGGSEQRE
jgi:hypothetical protein